MKDNRQKENVTRYRGSVAGTHLGLSARRIMAFKLESEAMAQNVSAGVVGHMVVLPAMWAGLSLVWLWCDSPRLHKTHRPVEPVHYFDCFCYVQATVD